MKAIVKPIQFPALANYGILVVVAKDLQKAMADYEETKNIPFEDKDFGTGVAWTVHVLNEPRSFTFLRPGAAVGTIAHESWHIVHHIFNHIDAKFENELVAYHLGYLVNEIYSLTRRK